MSLTREDMLRELELLPVWQLRQPLVTTAASPSTMSAPSVETPQPATPAMLEMHGLAKDVTSTPSQSEEVREEAPAVEAEATLVALPDMPAPTPLDGAPAVTAEQAVNVEAGLPNADTSAKASAVPEGVGGNAEPVADRAMTPPWDDEIPPPDEMPLPIFDDEDHLPDMATSLGQGRRDSIAQLDWQALQSCVANCEACSLSRTRTQTVFGVGDPAAEWLIVGEAPGAEEDRRGEPFVGQAGQLLDNMLGAIQLKRGQNVYIANVLKCRPPQNRDPQGEEVQQCDPFLKRQVELIKPKLILALGKFAAQSLLNSEATIGSMRGRLHAYNGVPVIVTYHPAYLLRNLMDKAKAWEDLCLARATMRKLQEDALQSASAPSSKD